MTNTIENLKKVKHYFINKMKDAKNEQEYNEAVECGTVVTNAIAELEQFLYENEIDEDDDYEEQFIKNFINVWTQKEDN